MITDQDIILRIVIGAFLGALVGYERERQGRPQGCVPISFLLLELHSQ